MKKSQVQIKFENLAAGKAAVEKVFLTAAGKFDLFDNTDTSRVPDTIRSMVEAKGFGFGLGARVLNDVILVDFNPRPNRTPKFEEVYNFILSELVNAFPEMPDAIQEGNPGYLDTR